MREPLLSVRNLQVHFKIRDRKAWPWQKPATLKAVDGVSFDLYPGETLGVVGESGCGKSTLARACLNLIPATGGEIVWCGKPLHPHDERAWLAARADIQMIFQDPLASLNPRMTVARIIGEPLRIHRPELNDEQVLEKVRAVMAEVGLTPQQINRYPREFSGGQCQRIGIARALALQPKVVVLDEPLSALDMSIQSQVLNLLVDLRERLDLSYVFISHDLSIVEYLCDNVAVMYLGRVVESAPAAQLFASPRHPYTQALLASVPDPDPRRERPGRPLEGDVPGLLHAPDGCAFHTRCPLAEPRCRESAPELRIVDTTGLQRAACHLL